MLFFDIDYIQFSSIAGVILFLLAIILFAYFKIDLRKQSHVTISGDSDVIFLEPKHKLIGVPEILHLKLKSI